jgi:hypothetical protein
MKIIRKLSFELNEREEQALTSILEDVRANGHRSWEGKIVSFDELKEIEVTDRTINVSNKPELWTTMSTPPEYTLRIHLQCLHEKARRMEFRDVGEHRLNAMFYPSSTLDNETLKHALLYFDGISFLTPEKLVLNDSHAATPEENKGTLRGHILSPSVHEKVDEAHELTERILRFYDETLELRRVGLLHSLPPSDNLSDAFYEAIEQDLGDPSFMELVRRSNLHPFLVGRSKFILLGDSKETRELLNRYLENEEVGKFVKHYYRHYGDHPMGQGFGFIRLSPELGASILLNHTIAACHKYDLVPFTDKSVYQNFLLNKFQRVSRSKLIADYKRQLRITSSVLARRVMELHLPKLELRSFEDVLELKRRMAGELERFRYEMTKFAAEVQATPLDESYEKEIERVIAAKINPAKADVEAKLRGVDRKFAVRIIKGAKAGTVPIIATLFAGIPLPYVLALSAGVITLEALWEARVERKEITNANGLSFLFEVRD